jgi:hypothetical protein
MNEINLNLMNIGENAEFSAPDGSSSIYKRPPAVSFMERLDELEMENARLHRLVAELLIKNQQLRTSH